MDEVAAASAQDPVALRLRHLDDARGAGLVRRVAAQANWQPRGERTQANQNVRRGRGFAYASTIEAGEANAQASPCKAGPPGWPKSKSMPAPARSA
ncbi:hypothetical protein ACU4GD_30150 [Cupriavidus basilensis]